MSTNEKNSIDAQASGEKPYRLGLALGGGGVRGLAHAGAIKAMLEAGIKPDIVAGVSAAHHRARVAGG